MFIYHNGHHGCYLAVKIVSYILKKGQGRPFEKERIQFIDLIVFIAHGILNYLPIYDSTVLSRNQILQ